MVVETQAADMAAVMGSQWQCSGGDFKSAGYVDATGSGMVVETQAADMAPTVRLFRVAKWWWRLRGSIVVTMVVETQALFIAAATITAKTLKKRSRSRQAFFRVAFRS